MFEFDLYCDADGCVTDFDGYVRTHTGKRVSDFQKGTFWSWLQHHDANVEKFFRNLPKMPDADELVAYMTANFRSVKILTASGYTPKDGPQQKRDWFAEHYPNLECIVVPKSADKAQYATPNAILIDDRSKSIDPWVAAGGIGILHTSAASTIAQLANYVTR